MLTFVNLTVQYISDWTASGERDVYIDYDIETYPLQIMTDSVMGSEDWLYVTFYQADGSVKRGIKVKFTAPPSYWIGHCSSNEATFTAPEEQVRIWTYTMTDTSLILACNGVEIVNYLFSESTRDECVSQWIRDAGKIKFRSDSEGTDTASDKYRAKPTGKSIVI